MATLATPHDSTRCVVYAAKSTADEHDSIPSQLEACRERAAHLDWTVDSEWSDEKASAYSGSRGPGLRDARARCAELAAARKEVVLLVFATDRLARGDGRDAAHLVEYVLEATKHGYRIESVSEDIGGQMALVLAALYGERNTRDSQVKSEHTRRGKRAAAELGKWGGGRPPYGYRQVDGELAVVPAQREVVLRIDREVMAGVSYRRVALDLNDSGLRTALGNRWTQAAVRGIVASSFYVGRVKHRGVEHDGNHDAIRSEADWLALGAAVRSRRGGAQRGQKQPRDHLNGRGRLRCGACGDAMVARPGTYRCGTEFFGKGTCDMPTVRRELVDGAILDYFQRAALDVDATRAAIAEACDRLLSETRSSLDAARTEAARADESLDRVKRDYLDGELSAAKWCALSDELEAGRAAAGAAVERLEDRLAEVEASSDLFDAEGEALAFLADLRSAVAGTVASAETVAAARQALLGTFDGFTLHSVAALPEQPPPLPDGWIRSRTFTPSELRLVGGWVIEPHPKPSAILDPDKQVEFPILRRVGLRGSLTRTSGPSSGSGGTQMPRAPISSSVPPPR
jgi:DNA invertase Pin-like site-specific DNA recombinase